MGRGRIHRPGRNCRYGDNEDTTSPTVCGPRHFRTLQRTVQRCTRLRSSPGLEITGHVGDCLVEQLRVDARVGTQVPLRETARVRTQEPFEGNSQGKGPRKFQGRGHKEERWRSQEKEERRKVEEKKEEEKKRKKRSVRKVHEQDCGVRLERVLSVLSRRDGRRRKKKRRVELKRGIPRRDKALDDGADGFFSFCCWDNA